ncbi:uncharacterized protein LOC115323186 [Ixodes scapularis]|uniref:uncharacterized protein LOC115323186 n=1 Tax=Ixodes scapularis TaxID=6945 RepID=UPI001A9D58B5|nr:uncharacterized protein LOC115323186 [Ixodes scapularis]
MNATFTRSVKSSATIGGKDGANSKDVKIRSASVGSPARVTQMEKDQLWAELVAELNAIGPAIKNRRSWQHYWTDRVRAAKKKADEFSRNSGGTGGGAVPGEAGRIISIVGPDAVEGCGAPAVPGPQLRASRPAAPAPFPAPGVPEQSGILSTQWPSNSSEASSD